MMLRGTLIRIRIDRRDDFVPVHLVERLYQSALDRGDDVRAEYLLDRLTDPTAQVVTR